MKQKIIHLIRSQLLKLGFRITRLTSAPRIEDYIFQATAPLNSVFCLQVGAHDGLSNDPLSHFRARPDWRHILLEPNPSVFARLEQNLGRQPNCKPLNVAISDTEAVMPFYIVSAPEQSREPYWADQVSSLHRSHVEEMLKKFGHPEQEINDLIQEIGVHATTFDRLLQQQDWSRLDVLFIDAEGADFRLLKTFPFHRFRPLLIVFECAHIPPNEKIEIAPFLSGHGYSFLPFGEDLVCIDWKRLPGTKSEC